MIHTLLTGVQLASTAALIGWGAILPVPEREPAQAAAQPFHQPEAQPDAQPQPAAARPEDVQTLDGVIKAFYESTAGPAGQARDWDRLRSLCNGETRFLAARPTGDGGSVIFSLTIEDYIMHNRRYFEKGGFFDSEIARRTETFGNITHVWSTFESRRGTADSDPYARGIYSIQLLRNDDRWWILSVLWDHERAEDNPMPEKYLTTPEE